MPDPAASSPRLSPDSPVQRNLRRLNKQREAFDAVRGRRMRALRLGLVGLVLAGALYFGARPLHHQFKAWRSRSKVAESARFSREGNFAATFESARAAYELCPEEPLAVRALGGALMRAGNYSDALAFERLLVRGRHPSEEDRRALIACALSTAHWAEAEAQLSVLLRGGAPSLAADFESQAQLKLSRKDLPGALADLRAGLQHEPGHVASRALLGRLLLGSAGTHAEGEQILRTLAADENEKGLEALLTLACDEAATLEGAAWVYPRLASHRLATDAYRLKALELQVRCEPQNRASLLDAAQARYADARPEVVARLADLLAFLKEPERVLATLPEDSALTRFDWLLLRLDALSVLRRWEEVLALLKLNPRPLPRPLNLLFQSRCEGELGHRDEAAALWHQALAGAGEGPRLLEFLVRYASEHGSAAQLMEARARWAQWRAANPQPEPGEDGEGARGQWRPREAGHGAAW